MGVVETRAANLVCRVPADAGLVARIDGIWPQDRRLPSGLDAAARGDRRVITPLTNPATLPGTPHAQTVTNKILLRLAD